MSGTGIRSREGNAIIAVVGVTYVLAAVALFVIHYEQTIFAHTFVENAVDAVLAAIVVLGGWFVVDGLRSLGLIKLRSRALRLRPSRAAASP